MVLCRVHAVCVCDDAKYFYSHVDEQLQAYGITKHSEGKPVRARDIVDIIDGYKGEGYGKSTGEELGELYPPSIWHAEYCRPVLSLQYECCGHPRVVFIWRVDKNWIVRF